MRQYLRHTVYMNTLTIAMMFVSASQTFNLPPGLLSALCFAESSHRVHITHHDDGGSDSLGICQIKLSTAKGLGFEGTRENLMRPKTNIHYAAKYLSKQFKKYHGALYKSIASYNSGTYRPNELGLPKNAKYVNNVLRAWKEQR